MLGTTDAEVEANLDAMDWTLCKDAAMKWWEQVWYMGVGQPQYFFGDTTAFDYTP